FRAPAALDLLRFLVEPALQRVPALGGLEEREELGGFDLLDVLGAVLLAIPWRYLDFQGAGIREPCEVGLRLGPRQVRAEAVVDELDHVRGDPLTLRGLDAEEPACRLRRDRAGRGRGRFFLDESLRALELPRPPRPPGLSPEVQE